MSRDIFVKNIDLKPSESLEWTARHLFECVRLTIERRDLAQATGQIQFVNIRLDSKPPTCTAYIGMTNRGMHEFTALQLNGLSFNHRETHWSLADQECGREDPHSIPRTAQWFLGKTNQEPASRKAKKRKLEIREPDVSPSTSAAASARDPTVPTPAFITQTDILVQQPQPQPTLLEVVATDLLRSCEQQRRINVLAERSPAMRLYLNGDISATQYFDQEFAETKPEPK